MITVNEKGTVIYKNPNYDCEFCIPPDTKMTEFYTCLNPELNYHFKKLGSWTLSCPPDTEVCNYVLNLDGDDFNLVYDFINANDDKSKWMVIDQETIQYIVENLSIDEIDYFLWFMKLMGWQQYIDKDDELDVNGGMVFTQNQIDIFKRDVSRITDDDQD